ncbi:MAG TPA: lysophospholipid acyltransferase family protein [Actinomycetes bacterium]
MAELVYPPVIALARGVFALQGLRFTLRGTEHVPTTGGAVMAINHVGYLDFTYAGLAARPAGRLVRFMAKDEVFTHRISGPLMRGMHHIPVDRDAGAGSYRHAVDALRAGEIVGVFPEATISRSFELKDFKAGAVRMAAEAGVPVLPTVIWGSQRVWTKGHPKRLGRTRVPITIAVGEPFAVDEGSDPSVVTAELRARMERMLHEAQETYPEHPVGGADSWWQPARLGGTAPTPDEALALDRDERRRRLAAAKEARDRHVDKSHGSHGR